MKKFLKLFAIMLCLALSSIAFVACGNKGGEETKTLKAADFVGTWYVESEVYSYNGETDTSTYARFKELHDAGVTASDNDEYADLETVINKFKVSEDGSLQWKQFYADDSDYDDAGTWAIVDNKLTVDLTGFLGGDVTVEYTNGKIVIHQSFMWLEKLQTTDITLVKVA